MTTATILVGDVRDRLRELPDGCARCCVTSPPYWGLRQYLFDKATVVRDDLTHEEKAWLVAELDRRCINPRRDDGSIQERNALEAPCNLP